MTGDIFGPLQEKGVTGISWVETRDAAERLATQRTGPTADPAPNVTGAQAEKRRGGHRFATLVSTHAAGLRAFLAAVAAPP